MCFHRQKLISQIRAKLPNLIGRGFVAKQIQPNKSKKCLQYLKYIVGGAFGSLVLYDAVKNEFLYCGASVRFLRSLKTAGLICVDYFWFFARNKEEDSHYEDLIKLVHKNCAERLLQTCLLNGGLYIKVGQGFAAINHILPSEYTKTLSQLQDKCLPTSKRDVQKVFKKEFGQLPEEVYQEFNYKPVAAASLAQVFKAKLRSGEEVAVKVQYNDLQKRFTSDLTTIIWLQDMIEWCFKGYNFGWILKDLKKNLEQELNFKHEASNAERCANHLKKFPYVHVPKIYWNYSTMRVLTLEWINGCKISDVGAIQEQFKLDLRDVDIKLFRIFAEQIFKTGFVHADPHPGNIFVRKNMKSGKAELVVLDHGLYEKLPEKFRKPLCEFWEAAVLRNETKMQKAAEKLHIEDYMRFAEILFQQPLRLYDGRIKTKLTQQDIDYMQERARKNFDMIMNTLKVMPRNMLFVVRNLNTIRAVSQQHGDVVDRPKEMARHAQRSLYEDHQSYFAFFHFLYRRFMFEYSIWNANLQIKLMRFYFHILFYLGRAPESAKTVFYDILKQTEIP